MATQYPTFQPYQQFIPNDPNAMAKTSHDILANALPGLDKATGAATANTANLLGGLPSAAPTQRANAYFGAASGMPGSDFVRNRGFDLYGQQAESYKQRGFDDFLALLKGASGTIAPTTSEQAQTTLQNQQLQTQQSANNSQIAGQNNSAALQRQAEGAKRWEAEKAMDNRRANSYGGTLGSYWGRNAF